MSKMADGGEGAAAAAPPPLPAIDPILAWWIKIHQAYFTRMITGTPYKIKYYGGFALNLGITDHSMPSRLGIFKRYTDGYAFTREAASDIDAKVLGVPNESEAAVVTDMLQRARQEGAPMAIAAEAANAAREALGRGDDQVVIAGPAQLHGLIQGAGIELQYILGHRLYYGERPPGGGATIHHSQLVLNAVFTDATGAWRWQTLSELTPSNDPVDAATPAFQLTDLATLLLQFQVLQAFVSDRLKQEPDSDFFQRRLDKTTNRIAAIFAVRPDLLLAAMAAAGPGSGAGVYGGGLRRRTTRRHTRRRRRNSVKR